MRKTTIAITGADGFLGTQLTMHFSKKGWQVTALVRNPRAVKPASGVKYVEYDLSKPFDKSVLVSADYLVHTAYIKKSRRYPDAMNLNISGAKHLLDASRHNKIKNAVFLSSMSAHDEAVSAYGRQKLAIEKLFKKSGYLSIRSGLIIGDGGIVKQMVGFMKSKRVVPLIGGGKQPLQIISVHDLTRVIDKLLSTSRIKSDILTIANPAVYTYKEFYEAIAKKLHIKVLFVPVPFFLLLSGLKVIEFLHLPLSVNQDNALGLKYLRAVDTTQDLEKIGVQLETLEVALDFIK